MFAAKVNFVYFLITLSVFGESYVTWQNQYDILEFTFWRSIFNKHRCYRGLFDKVYYYTK